MENVEKNMAILKDKNIELRDAINKAIHDLGLNLYIRDYVLTESKEEAQQAAKSGCCCHVSGCYCCPCSAC